MVNWSTTAFVFPGQQSQHVGMGKDLAEEYPAARQVFEQADDILSFKLSELCFNGPEAELNDTINTQPAIFTCSIAVLHALQSECSDAAALMMAGHSFGEITALTAAGALTFEDGLRLVRERGRVMKEADEKSPGAMAAVLGLESDVVRDLCERASQQTGAILVLANDNCPGQTVISGSETALERGMELAKEAGAKRVIRLQISIAAHSPLMEQAAEQFRQALAVTPFQKPAVPVMGNSDVEPLFEPEQIRQTLGRQLTGPVRWTGTIHAMIDAGAQTFLELGPKDVLTGLLKRIDREKAGSALNSVAALRQFAQNSVLST